MNLKLSLYASVAKTIITLTLLVMHVVGKGQSIQFKEFGIKDGFTSLAGHRAFAQDSLGFLWIGTGGGLYQFDGYHFKHYQRDPNNPNSILTEGVQEMSVDPSGKLWIIYKNQMQFYDRNIDGFVTVKVLPEKSQIRTVFFDSPESIWIGSYGTGLYHYDLTKGSIDTYINEAPDTLLQDNRNYIYDISYQGRFLVLGTRDGLWKFDRTNKTFQRPYATESEFIASWNHSFVNRILKAKNHFWISTSIKMLKLDTAFMVLDQAPVGNFGTIEDAEGNLWLPKVNDGIIYYNAREDKVTHYQHDPGDSESLPSNQVNSVFLDRNNNVWLGLWNGGLCKIVRRPYELQRYLKGQTVTGVSLPGKGKDKQLVVATFGGGAFISAFSGSVDNLVFSKIAEINKVEGFQNIASLHLAKNYLWVGSQAHGVLGISLDSRSGKLEDKKPLILKGNPDDNTISDGISANIFQGSFDDLWIATNGSYFVGGGNLNKVYLNKTYGEAGSFKTYWGFHPETKSRSWISGILQETANSFWVSSYRGLELFHIDTETFDQVVKDVEGASLYRTKDGTILFGTKRGLYEGVKGKNGYEFKKSDVPGNVYISSINEDTLGRKWINTTSGLFIHDQRDQSLILLNDDALGDRLYKCTMVDGRYLFLPGKTGLSIVDVLSFKVQAASVTPVLTQLKVNNKIADVAQNLTEPDQFVLPENANTIQYLELDHNHRNLSIEFASMDLTSPADVLYRYKLEGEKDWVVTNAANRNAHYSNLETGLYQFLVEAADARGVWSELPRILTIRVLPPPWKTWWAYTGYFIFVAGLLLWARRNIVQQERLKANLQLAKVEQEKEHFELEKAHEVDRVKTSFFTNISHEFRTPLTLIKGPVQNILEKYKDDPKLQEQLKLVQRNSDLLLRLINQLLDLAKLESGSLKVERTEGELFSFIRAIVSSFESFARQKNVSIEINVPASNVSAFFDKDKVETILINLINNAIKFTPTEGTVTVSGFVANNTLKLSVTDTGIGIPLEQQSKIFERFHQVSEAHKEVGTGIGLALVKELVALMDGIIEVKSEVGIGSGFVVTLPIEFINVMSSLPALPLRQTGVSETSPLIETSGGISHSVRNDGILIKEVRSANDAGSTSVKPHVLVVEDNTDLRHFIIDSLGNEFNFLEAENGKLGLAKATEEIPDLIISDVMMPEMDGITMAGKIKSDIRTSHIPLILLTAKSSEDSKLQGLQSGADDYLTKPFNKNELLLKVRNGVSRQVKLREKLRAELMSTAPKVEVMSEDERFLNSVKEKILERLSDEQLSVESLAEDIGMSRVQLYRKVTGLAGISVNELIRKLRLQRAAQLLQQNWGPVSQVAYEVGFSNLSYFSKVFKEEFGVLPSEYEKS